MSRSSWQQSTVAEEEAIMVAVNLVDLDAYREERARREFLASLEGGFKEWFLRWEETVKEKGSQPTLLEVTESLREHRQDLLAMVAKQWIEQKYREYLEQEQAECPHCGHTLSRWGTPQRSLETLIGSFPLARPYFYCRGCNEGFCPLDEVLGLARRDKQYDLQQAATRVATEMSFQESTRLFEELTKVSVCDSTLHEVVGEVSEGLGVLEVAPTREEIGEKVKEVGQGKRWRPIMVLALDGAHVPTRPEGARGTRPGRKKERANRPYWRGEWREAKGFRFYLVNRDRIVHLLSWHQIQTEEECAEALRQVKEAGLIDEGAVRLCVAADGARWIWKRVKELFPTAHEILDYYHCSEHLHKVAEVQWKESPPEGVEWLEATMARLFCGEVDGVLGSFADLKPTSEQARNLLENCRGYLEANRERVDYGAHRKGGYPLGSGAIESAHKFICEARLKRSGAWWYVANGNGLLALRCAKYNGTFERVFQRYVQREQRQNYPRGAILG